MIIVAPTRGPRASGWVYSEREREEKTESGGERGRARVSERQRDRELGVKGTHPLAGGGRVVDLALRHHGGPTNVHR